MRQTKLLAYSKELKLTFYTNQQTPNSNHKVRIFYENKAIYILQTITVDQHQYSPFL